MTQTTEHSAPAGAGVLGAKVLGANGCRQHPSPSLMAGYVAGRLACAEAVAVATHIALCPDCQAVHQQVVGGVATVLDSETPADSAPDFTRCLIKAKMQQRCAERQTARLDLPAAVVPLLRKYAGCAHWWPVYPGVKRLCLNIRSPQKDSYHACLFRIKAGTKLPCHIHEDVEYMVVLRGTMVDENGTHGTGAFLTTHPGEQHTPQATDEGDVVVLNIARGSVRFTSKWLAWLNPFLRRECSVKTA